MEQKSHYIDNHTEIAQQVSPEAKMEVNDISKSVTVDGFTLRTRAKATLILLIDPSVILNPSGYSFIPETDMLEGHGISFRKDLKISPTADTRLKEALKNDRVDG